MSRVAMVTGGTRGIGHAITARLKADGFKVAPGYTDTEMVRSVSEKRPRTYCRRNSRRRLGKAEEIAACVSFLAREDASFITGACLTVNGGQYMA